jgi:hypothetical protein
MSHKHEYALLGGVSRAKIGRYIGIAAASISAGIVFLLLTAVDIAKAAGVPATLPPSVLSLVGAGAVFSVLYWFFDRYVWSWGVIAQLLKVPDLRGEWEVKGKTLYSDGKVQYEWDGKIAISQSWDKIRVRLKTAQSGSNSISAALIFDEIDGYILLYHYINEPKLGESLSSHRGFAELLFSKDLQSASGEYFNGHGRFTFGNLELRRI